MSGAQETLGVALVRDVFPGADSLERLTTTLRECKDLGAEVAVLPEIALHPWSPATKEMRDEDAEPAGGSRESLQREAAAAAGIALLGASIRRFPDGRRENTSLFIDSKGELRSTYAKMHIPEEPGFWETSHYGMGTVAPEAVDTLTPSFPFGSRICSDINRPLGSHVLAAQGASWIANPRATESATYDRWRACFLTTALTTGLYVISVPRPAPEQGVLLGGPSFAVSPTGEVLYEGEDRIAVVQLKREVLEEAKVRYPGYLPQTASVYAQALLAAN